MIPASLPDNEDERLKALERYEIMDTDPEEGLDEIVLLASQICETPISLISLVDNYRQWFKARVGLGAEETPRDLAFCAHAILENKLFEVPNTLEDDRFHDNPLVTEDPSIRFYAGVPLRTSDNFNLGTLCVIDSNPRTLTDFQRNALTTLSNHVVMHLELKLKMRLLSEEHRLTLEKTEQLARANEELEDTQMKLFRTEKRSVLNMVSASLAHELNNPINYISGGVQVLRGNAGVFEKMVTVFNELEKAKEEEKPVIIARLQELHRSEDFLTLLTETDEMHFEIAEGAKRASEMVQVLQTFAQSEINMVGQINLNKNIRAVLKIMHSKWLHRSTILTDLSEDLPKIYCRPSGINELLVSILQNAAEATEGTGEIRISSRQDGDFVVLEIADNGRGVAEGVGAQIYDSSYTTKKKSNGIGLTLASDIVKSHQGKISYFSETGNTVFKIRLPIHPNLEPDQAEIEA